MATVFDEKILGERQKIALAQKLRESGQEMLQGRMIGDRFVGPSWTQGLAQALKQGLGAYQEVQAENKIKDIQNERLKEVISARARLGIPSSQKDLEAVGTPEQTPSVFRKIGGALGFIDKPETIPAVPMQQPQLADYAKLTKEQRNTAILSAVNAIPNEATAIMTLGENEAAREATKELKLAEIESREAIAKDKYLLLQAINANRPQPQGSVVTIDDPKDPNRQIKMSTLDGTIYGYEAKQNAISPQQQQKMNVAAGEEANTATALFSKINEIQKTSQELKTSPGLPGISGYRGIFPNLPGSDASLAQNKYDNLMGKITSLGKDVAASSGAVGNMAVQEWGILRDTIAKIDPTKLGTKATKDTLEELDASLNRLASRAKQSYERTYEPQIEKDPARFGLKFTPYQPQTTKVNDIQSEADAIIGRK